MITTTCLIFWIPLAAGLAEEPGWAIPGEEQAVKTAASTKPRRGAERNLMGRVESLQVSAS